MMNGHRKSDSFIVPEKSPNKDRDGSAEVMEGRGGWPRGIGLSKTRTGRRAGETCQVRLSGYGKWQEEVKVRTWKRMEWFVTTWFPPVRIYHPYPLERLRV